MITFLMDKFAEMADAPAMIYRGQVVTYRWLADRVRRWEEQMRAAGLKAGEVVAMVGDYSPETVSLLLALVNQANIIVPLTSTTSAYAGQQLALSQAEWIITAQPQAGGESFQRLAGEVSQPLLRALKEAGEPGLIVFSSGSTGEPKAILHNFLHLLEKYKKPRRAQRILVFLLLDHLGGINTALHTLANGGTMVTVQERSPEEICRLIETYQVEVLPTTPTFLNLLLLSEAYRRFDLSSLRLITYGTEVMLASTLQRIRTILPDVELQQTYGLSELGVLRSKSRASDSLWVKIGGEEFETRVIEGDLYVRAQSAMLGYLNAPSPFTEDGWMFTGDKVEQDGEWIRILGRKSEVINVGGQKVFPAQVESVLLMMPGVEQVFVSGVENPITGQMVMAQVRLCSAEALQDFRRRMRQFCQGRLEAYMIPQKVVLVDGNLYNRRFKKMRLEAAQNG